MPEILILGVDGAGKSTLAKKIAHELSARNHPVVLWDAELLTTIRNPGDLKNPPSKPMPFPLKAFAWLLDCLFFPLYRHLLKNHIFVITRHPLVEIPAFFFRLTGKGERLAFRIGRFFARKQAVLIYLEPLDHPRRKKDFNELFGSRNRENLFKKTVFESWSRNFRSAHSSDCC